MDVYNNLVDFSSTAQNSPEKQTTTSGYSAITGRLMTEKKKSKAAIAPKTSDPASHMDILKKFRYNFHYWLRNCYQDPEALKQPETIPSPKVPPPEEPKKDKYMVLQMGQGNDDR